MPSLKRSLGSFCLLSAFVGGFALPWGAYGQGQSYTLSGLTAGDQPGELQIRVFSGAAPPPFAAVQNKDLWRVTVYRKGGDHLAPADPPAILTGVNEGLSYNSTGRIRLTTSSKDNLDPNTDHTLVIEVNFFGGPAIVTAWLPSNAAPTPVESAKGGKGPAKSSAPDGGSGGAANSSAKPAGCGTTPPAAATSGGINFNYCLSGIWVPQVGSHPLYSTDSNFLVGYRSESFKHSSFGLYAQESADSSVVLDPNAFSSALFYQADLWDDVPSRYLNSVLFRWNLATVEFDRKKKNTNLGTNVNLITAPQLAFPISLGRFGLELTSGIEYGHNFKNNINPNGFGTVFRGLLGAQLMRIYTAPKALSPLKTIKLSSQYQARLLEDDEVITRSVHGKLVPYKGHQTRNWVSTEIDFMFTSNFGLTLKHDYGALPPGYVLIENRATVGITIQSSQK